LRDQAEIDSFDFYQVIVQVAERTGVNVPDSKLAEMKNLDQLISFVSEKSNQH
jgi:acyl carrier protein